MALDGLRGGPVVGRWMPGEQTIAVLPQFPFRVQPGGALLCNLVSSFKAGPVALPFGVVTEERFLQTDLALFERWPGDVSHQSVGCVDPLP